MAEPFYVVDTCLFNADSRSSTTYAYDSMITYVLLVFCLLVCLVAIGGFVGAQANTPLPTYYQ